ncbi:MAG TPA: hypothetical protein VIV40_02740 [Kofleriaceae bacterium]
MRIPAVLGSLALAPGCMYMHGNLEQKKDGTYTNYPADVAAEHARRKTRRRNALIAAPLEIVGGAGLTALALFAKSTPMDDGDDSITDNLGDAGKEIAGRILLAGIGGAGMLGGVGDLVFAAADPMHGSPLVRDGELVKADRIDVIEPDRSPWLTVHMTNVIGTHAVGGELGFGFAHWLDSRIRLRHAVSGTFGFAWDRTTQAGVTAETNVQLAFGRRGGGLYPRNAIGVYGGGGWVWTTARDAPVAIGGISYDMGITTIRLGTRYAAGVDRYPSIDLGTQIEFGSD